MLIKKYVGRNERALLQKIRAELGPDPVILHTAFLRPKGMFRWLRRPAVEIVAGGGFQIVRERKGGAHPANGNGRKNGAAPPAPAAPRPPAPAAPAVPPDQWQRELLEIRRMMAEQRELMRHERLGGWPGQLAEEYMALTANEVSQRLSHRLLKRIQETLPSETLRDPAAVRKAVRDSLREMIPCEDGITLKPGKCTRVAFVGPTGVGKTTTIGKLMSIYSHRGKEVAVITNDTYRIAATEQIRRVAELVGVPVRICRGPEEIAKAVQDFSDRDLLLVDTAGRSQKSRQRIGELQKVLAAAQADEVHLVVSMTTQLQTMLDVVESFTPVGFHKIVLTKMDEAVKIGLIIDVLSQVDRALSFITTGQEIPRDIEIADPSRLASLILGEEALA